MRTAIGDMGSLKILLSAAVLLVTSKCAALIVRLVMIYQTRGGESTDQNTSSCILESGNGAKGHHCDLASEKFLRLSLSHRTRRLRLGQPKTRRPRQLIDDSEPAETEAIFENMRKYPRRGTATRYQSVGSAPGLTEAAGQQAVEWRHCGER